MLKIAIGQEFEFPATIVLRDGAEDREFPMRLRVKRLTESEVQEAVRAIDSEPSQSVARLTDFMRGVVLDVSDQQLVLDGEGQPAPFGPAMLDALLGVSGVPMALYMAWLQAAQASHKPEARRKNSRG